MAPLVKVPVRFGLMGVGVLLGIFLIYYFSGNNPLIEMDMLDLFIVPIFLYFGVREYRDNFNNGKMEFWQGMTAGLFIYMIIAAVFSGVLFLFLEYLDTSLAESYIDSKLAELSDSEQKIIEEMGQASYDEMVTSTTATTVKVLVLDTFLRKVAIGFFLTSVISIVMKRKNKS